VNEILLTILNETLDDLTQAMRKTQEDIEKQTEEIRKTKARAEIYEEKVKCEAYQKNQVKQQISVLTTYLNTLGKLPSSLMEKREALEKKWKRIGERSDLMEIGPSRLQEEIDENSARLDMLKQRYADIRKEWDGITRLISQERENARA
jgi:chromosome segregation ATPase